MGCEYYSEASTVALKVQIILLVSCVISCIDYDMLICSELFC